MHQTGSNLKCHQSLSTECIYEVQKANFYISFLNHSHVFGHIPTVSSFDPLLSSSIFKVRQLEKDAYVCSVLFTFACLQQAMKDCSFHSHKLSLQHSMHTETTMLQFESNSDALSHWTVCLDCVWGNMRPTSSISSLQQPHSLKKEKWEENCFFSTFSIPSKNLFTFQLWNIDTLV